MLEQVGRQVKRLFPAEQGTLRGGLDDMLEVELGFTDEFKPMTGRAEIG
jgi:hypothetical protein